MKGEKLFSCLLRLVRKTSITQRSPESPSSPKFQVFLGGAGSFFGRKLASLNLHFNHANKINLHSIFIPMITPNQQDGDCHSTNDN